MPCTQMLSTVSTPPPHTVAGLGTAWENEPAKTDETEPEKPQKGKHGP